MIPMMTEDWRSEFDFPLKQIRLGRYQFQYVDEGQGPPLVFVHGNPTWSFYWRRLLAELRHHYRVIALDHLGSGGSDRPAGYVYSMPDHSRNLAHFLDRLELTRITLVAHDWGGAIGLHCGLVERPETLDRVILFNTGAFPPPRVPWRIAICCWPWIGPLLIQGLNAFPRAALHLAVIEPSRLSARARRGILAPYRSWRQRAGIMGFLRDIPRSPRHPTWQQLQLLESQLARLRSIPTALIWGMRDWCFDSVCLERLHAGLPHAEVTRIEDAGHWVVEDAADECLATMRNFLDRHPVDWHGRGGATVPVDGMAERIQAVPTEARR